MGVVASGPGDVWLFGQYPTSSGPYHPWIVHFGGGKFMIATTPRFASNAGAIIGGALIGSAVLAYGSIDTGDFDVIPKFIAACPIQVTRKSIIPSNKWAPIGAQTFWSVSASPAARHDLVSAGLFNSGTIDPGGFFEYKFFAAGTYTVQDTQSGFISKVEVQTAVRPAAGSTGTVFAITSASIQSPVGYSYQILIKRPTSRQYALLTRTGQPTTNFIPDAGAGTYSFECELRTPSGLTSPSTPVEITVS
jgi:hypothetical protein